MVVILHSLNGLTAPRHVVEVHRSEQERAPTQPRNMAARTALQMDRTLKPKLATLKSVQVKRPTSSSQLYRLSFVNQSISQLNAMGRLFKRSLF